MTNTLSVMVMVVRSDLLLGMGSSKDLGGLEQHQDLGLHWFSGFHKLAGGRLIVANWLGQRISAMVLILLFLTQNKVCWKWSDHGRARSITNCLVLSVKSGETKED